MDIREKIKQLPISPGVYIFYDKCKKVLYIGKARNIKRRVLSYFQKKDHDLRISKMVEQIVDLEYIPTASNEEALIYESSLIKEKKPKYNVDLKDDKSYPSLKLTVKEKYPRLIITRDIKKDGSLYFGPYTNAGLLRRAVIFLRRLFPLRTCCNLPKKECLNYHIGQCLGPCIDDVERSYKEVVEDAKCLLRGRKKALIDRLSKRMDKFSKSMEFESAIKVKKQIEALSVLVDQSIYTGPLIDELKSLKDILGLKVIPATIECFDISNTSGTNAVGSMVSFFNGKPDKSNYRKYKIRTVKKIDDYAMIKEIVRRRYSRLLNENKQLPQLIMIDGGLGHLQSAIEIKKQLGLNIPFIAIAKKEEVIYCEGKTKPIKLSKDTKPLKLLQLIRDEAHRFAITYHKLLRKKGMFE
ncbi:MAG: excinuclease ABC subunit UvrC [Candidatus Omnitrophica bacterium]|nr:excinuclease ABC subunit UvrC [Candidatus Omnitrophota bacterium]